MNIPDGFLDGNLYDASIDTSNGVSTQRLVPQIGYPKAEIIAGDTIALNPIIEISHKNETFTIKNHTPQLAKVLKIGSQNEEAIPLFEAAKTDRVALVELSDKSSPPLRLRKELSL